MRSVSLFLLLGALVLGLPGMTPSQGDNYGPHGRGHSHQHRGKHPAAPPPTYYDPFLNRPSQVQPGQVIHVGAYDNYFQPTTLRVPAGTTVCWTNYGQHLHTVTSYTGRFDSGQIRPAEEYRLTLLERGVYEYYCLAHPRQMRGSVIVY